MYEKVEKPKENTVRAVANSVAQKKSNKKQQFVDNRHKRDSSTNLLKGRVNVLQLVTREGPAMRGVPPTSAAINLDINDVISGISAASTLMRGAGTLLTFGSARLDMQGKAGLYFNLQVQVGTGTVATVLLHPNVSDAQTAEVIQAFQQSLNTGNVYYVDPDPQNNEEPKGYYENADIGREDKARLAAAMQSGSYPPKPIK